MEWNNKNDAIPHPNHTHTHAENTSCTIRQHIVSRQEIFYKITNYSHRAQCLSPTQVAPGHVSEILTLNTGGVKPENPDLKNV